MKRLSFLAVMILFVFGLTACDFLPDEINTDNIEACLEDPTSEECKLEELIDLEDALVLDLINEVLALDLENLPIDQCDLYFDEESELLNLCEQGILDLFPEELTNFTATSAELDGLNFKVTGTHNLTDKDVYLLISVEQANGTILLSSIEFYIDGEQVKPLLDETSASVLFESFIMKLLDFDTTTDELCKLFVDEGIDQDCDGIKESFSSDYEEINVKPIRLDLSRFRGHVTVLKARDTGPDDEFIIDAEIIDGMLKITGLRHLNDEYNQVTEIFNNFMTSYFDSTVTDEEMTRAQDYNSSRSNTTSARLDDIDKYEEVEIIKLMPELLTGDIIVIYQLSSETDFETRVMKVTLENNGEIPTLFDEELMIVSDIDKAEEILNSYLDSLFSKGVNNSEFLLHYPSINPNLLLHQIIEDFDSALKVDMIEQVGDDEFKVTLKPEEMSSTSKVPSSLTMQGRILTRENLTFIDFRNIDNDCDDSCDVRTPALEGYKEYLSSYMDASISNDVLIEMYFETAPNDEFLTERNNHLETGSILRVIDFIGPISEDEFIFIIEESTATGSRVHVEPVRIMKRIDASSPLLLFGDPDDDDDSIPTTEKMDLLNEFMNQLNDKETFSCDTFVLPYRVETCNAIREELLAKGMVIEDIDLYHSESASLIHIRKRPGGTLHKRSETSSSTYVIHFYKDMENNVLFDFVEINFDEVNEVQIGLENLITQLNDPTLNSDEVCQLVDENSFSECQAMKNYLGDNNRVMLSKISTEGYFIQATLVFTNSEGTVLGEVMYDVRYGAPANSMTNPLYVESTNKGENPLYTEE